MKNSNSYSDKGTNIDRTENIKILNDLRNLKAEKKLEITADEYETEKFYQELSALLQSDIEPIQYEDLKNAAISEEPGKTVSDNALFIKYNSEMKEKEFLLKSLMVNLKFLKKEYETNHIRYSVFLDTVLDIIVWTWDTWKKHGVYGLTLSNFIWILKIFSLSIFKLGSLQYEMLTLKEGIDTTIPQDSSVLSIHIRAGENLEKKMVEVSLRYASDFFPQHFSLFSFRYFYCDSWLLYPPMKEILKPGSRIRDFMELFTITEVTDNNSIASQRISGSTDRNETDRLKESAGISHLHRSFMEYPQKFGTAKGYIELDSLFEKLIPSKTLSFHHNKNGSHNESDDESDNNSDNEFNNYFNHVNK